jgi:hypothetical protein
MVKSSRPHASSIWLIFLCPILTLRCKTCMHSASSFLTVSISCHVIAVFVSRKSLFINYILPYLCLLHEYHVIYTYSVRYYPRFHVTEVGLGTCYLWIRGHYSVYICTYRKVYKRRNMLTYVYQMQSAQS